ncbi:MAG TPA: DUF305 domain-containing protein [Actinomycetes bacterium]
MRRIALAVAAVALLAACGKAADDSSGAPAKPQPNQADVAFVQGMIPHHQQAIEMAGLIDGRTDRPELAKLAKDVTTTQSVEVSRMQGWLQAWGKPSSDMGEMDHGASPMPGMMGQAEMDELMSLKGSRFDLAFVEMMTRHHQGAIEMATTELETGSLGEVKQLARQIITAQQRETQQMDGWKRAWSTASSG